MKRGDVVIVALQGDFGKPRPAVVLQSDNASDSFAVVIVPITTTIVVGTFVRIDVMPSPLNGLRWPSQIMTERITAIPRAKVGQIAGHLDDETMRLLSVQVAILLGLN